MTTNQADLLKEWSIIKNALDIYLQVHRDYETKPIQEFADYYDTVEDALISFELFKIEYGSGFSSFAHVIELQLEKALLATVAVLIIKDNAGNPPQMQRFYNSPWGIKLKDKNYFHAVASEGSSADVPEKMYAIIYALAEK